MIAALGCALALAGPVGRTVAQAPPAPMSTTLAVSVFSGTNSIELISTTGAGPLELAGATDPFFAWSPDGEQLVFSREEAGACEGCSELYLVGAAGGSEHRLTDGATNGNPAFSPGGRLIAFDRCRSVVRGPCAIFSIGTDGRGLRRLTPWGAGEGPPVFSPDGRLIAFAGDSEQGIYVMDANGRRLHRLTRGNDEGPAFSPDGSQIAFTRSIPLGRMEAREDIFLIRPDGRGLRRLTDTGRENFDPDWSPDGHEIVYVGGLEEPAACTLQDAIYEISPTGSGRRQLSGPGARLEDPSFSPEEAQIAFLGETPASCPPAEGVDHLYVMSAAGTGQRQLGLAKPAAAGALAWRPVF